MTKLPIEPYFYTQPTAGSKNFEIHNKRLIRAIEIARHANEIILECPDTIQIITFNQISLRSGYSFDEVKDAIGRGEGNGITVSVSEEDRENIRNSLGISMKRKSTL